MNFVQGSTIKSLNMLLINKPNVQKSTINFDISNQSSNFSQLLLNSDDIIQDIDLIPNKSETNLQKIEVKNLELNSIENNNINIEEINGAIEEFNILKADSEVFSSELTELDSQIRELASFLSTISNILNNNTINPQNREVKIEDSYNLEANTLQEVIEIPLKSDKITEITGKELLLKQKPENHDEKAESIGDINSIIDQLSTIFPLLKNNKPENIEFNFHNINEIEKQTQSPKIDENSSHLNSTNTVLLKKIISGLESLSSEINQKRINIIAPNINNNNSVGHLLQQLNKIINNINHLNSIFDKIDKILPIIKNLSQNSFLISKIKDAIYDAPKDISIGDEIPKVIENATETQDKLKNYSDKINTKIENIYQNFSSDKFQELTNKLSLKSYITESVDNINVFDEKNKINFQSLEDRVSEVNFNNNTSFILKKINNLASDNPIIIGNSNIFNNNNIQSIENKIEIKSSKKENDDIFNINNILSIENKIEIKSSKKENNNLLEHSNDISSISPELIVTNNQNEKSNNFIENDSYELEDKSVYFAPIRTYNNEDNSNSESKNDKNYPESTNKQKILNSSREQDSKNYYFPINSEPKNIITNDASYNLVKPYSIRITDIPRYVSRIVTNQTTHAQTHITTMHLEPISLGKISIEISLNGASADIKFKVENKDSVKSIESQIANLKDNLAKSGIKIESINISQSNIQSDSDKNFGTNQFQGEQSRFKDQQTKKEYLKMINAFVNTNNPASNFENINLEQVQSSLLHKNSLEKYI